MRACSIVILLTAVLLVHASAISLLGVSKVSLQKRRDEFTASGRDAGVGGGTGVLNASKDAMLRLRGGEMVSRGKRNKKKGAVAAGKEVYMGISPSTRRYLSLCLFCTIVHCIGLPAPAMFALDKSKLYQLWRPFTASSYFGAPSMSMANSIYFLVRYGQTLETEFGTGVHTWFLLVQMALLTTLGLALGFPFTANSMVSAAVYVCSHLRPMEQMPFQFGLNIVSWQLPYCLMAIDMLSQQAAAAAWPHVLGIFTGHCYHFFTKVWPSMGGNAWLKAPAFFEKRFGGRKSSNIAGMDFRNKKEAGRGKVLNRAKTLNKKKGQALGAAASASASVSASESAHTRTRTAAAAATQPPTSRPQAFKKESAQEEDSKTKKKKKKKKKKKQRQTGTKMKTGGQALKR
jgi:Derlin-1